MIVFYLIFVPLIVIVLAAFITYSACLSVGYFSLPIASSQQPVWTKEISMPVARSEIAGTALNGMLYIIGGLDRNGQSTKTVEVYDPLADSWSTAVPLPQPLDHTAAVSYDGKLYVVGGGDLSADSLSNKLFIYDRITDRWKEGANLPTPRTALTANFINGTLYAIGGVDTSHAPVSTNEAYDPMTNTWTEKAPMPTAREHLASAVFDGKLYALGGRQTDNESPKVNLNDNEMYNPINDTWTVMEQMPTKRSGIAAAASPVDGNIYVFGGENPFKDDGPIKTFEEVEKYNPKSNKWTTEEPMPTARHGLIAIAFDDKIYTVAGGNKPGLSVSNMNEALQISQD